MIPRPWSVQLEVVEGCNLRCWFCGIHAIRGKDHDWKYMDPELVRAAFKELNVWHGKPRVELNNHGEPTLHPRFFEIVQIIRQECPKAQIQLQTNGYLFFTKLNPDANFEQSLRRFFKYGGNILAMNCYRKGTYEEAMERCKAYLVEHPDAFKLIDFYYDNPKNESIYHYHKPSERRVFVFNDLGAANVTKLSNSRLSKQINNEAGNSPADKLQRFLGVGPVTSPLDRCCSRVFRELTIGWNGVIPACCYDWSNDLVFGKFPQQSLQQIWESEEWQAARVLLHPDNADRFMSPCDKCNYNGGFRTGLIAYPEVDFTVAEAYSIIVNCEEKYGQYMHQQLRR